MHPVLKHLLDTDFADLKGSRFEGQIALTDEIVNLGLHDLIGKLKNPTAPPAKRATAPADPAPPDDATVPDPAVLMKHVNVEHLKYRTENGRTILEVKASV